MLTLSIGGLGLVLWWLGKACIVFGTLYTFGAILYWLRVEKKGALYKVRSWQENVKNNFLLTYFYFVSSALISLISVLGLSSTCFYIPEETFPTVFGAVIVALTFLTTLLQITPFAQEHSVIKTSAWIAHATVLAVPFYFFGERISTLTLLTTTFFLLVASTVGFVASEEVLTNLRGRLLEPYCIVLVCSLLGILLKDLGTIITSTLLTFSVLGGIMLYTSVFVVNTDYIIKEVQKTDEYDPLYTSAVLYLCGANLYMRVGLYYLLEESY